MKDKKTNDILQNDYSKLKKEKFAKKLIGKGPYSGHKDKASFSPLNFKDSLSDSLSTFKNSFSDSYSNHPRDSFSYFPKYSFSDSNENLLSDSLEKPLFFRPRTSSLLNRSSNPHKRLLSSPKRSFKHRKSRLSCRKRSSNLRNLLSSYTNLFSRGCCPDNQYLPSLFCNCSQCFDNKCDEYNYSEGFPFYQTTPQPPHNQGLVDYTQPINHPSPLLHQPLTLSPTQNQALIDNNQFINQPPPPPPPHPDITLQHTPDQESVPTKFLEQLVSLLSKSTNTEENLLELEKSFENLLHQKGNSQNYLKLHSSLLPPKPSFSQKDINLFKANLLTTASSLLELLDPLKCDQQTKLPNDPNMLKVLKKKKIHNPLLYSPDFLSSSLNPGFQSPANLFSAFHPNYPTSVPSQPIQSQVFSLQPNPTQPLDLRPYLGQMTSSASDFNQPNLNQTNLGSLFFQHPNMNNVFNVKLQQQIKNALEDNSIKSLQSNEKPEDFVIKDYLNSSIDLDSLSTQKLLNSSSNYFPHDSLPFQQKLNNILQQQCSSSVRLQDNHLQQQNSLLQQLQQPLLQQQYQDHLNEIQRNNQILQQQLNNSTHLNNFTQLNNPLELSTQQICASLFSQLSSNELQQIKNSLEKILISNNSTQSNSPKKLKTKKIPQKKSRKTKKNRDFSTMKIIRRQQRALKQLENKLDNHLRNFVDSGYICGVVWRLNISIP